MTAPIPTNTSRIDPRIWLLALGTFAVGTDSFVISGILGQLSHDLSISLDAAGNVVGSYSLAYGLSAPILAALTARLRKDRVAIGALAAFAVANALCAIAPSYAAIIAARVLAGLAAGLYTPTAYALAASLAPPERKGSALAAVALGITFSIVAGVPLGMMVGNRFGWHATFWLVGLLSLVAVGAIGVRPPRGLPAANADIGLRARFAPLVNGQTLLALLPSLVVNAGIVSTYTYLGALLGAHRFGTDAVVIVFFIFGLGGLIGSQVGGRLIDRFGPARLLFLFLIVGILDTAVFEISLASFSTVAVTSFLLHGTLWMVILGQQRRLIKLAPEHSAVVLALNNSCLYLGIAAGAALGGAIIRHGYGLDRIPYVSSALLVIGLLVFCVSLWREKTRAVSAIRPEPPSAQIGAQIAHAAPQALPQECA